MKFPKRLRFKDRGRVLATIYHSKHGHYSVYWRMTIDGKRRTRLKDFDTYSKALAFGKEKVAEIGAGKLSATLSPSQVADSLAAVAQLRAHFQKTKREFSLLDSVSQFCAADGKLNGRLLSDAVEGYLTNAADVQGIGIKEAVEKFIAKYEPQTKPEKPGERAELGKGYLSQKKWHLLKLANMFAGYSVRDLTEAHIDRFFKELPNLPQRQKNALRPNSPKSRNHYRGSLRSFFKWAVKKYYLPANHRLNQADAMESESSRRRGKIEIYQPAEFRQLLENADERLRPVIAICGLAGIRVSELLRLTWEDIWRERGHVDVSEEVAKTDESRMVEMEPSLEQWLAPYRQRTGKSKIWPLDESKLQDAILALCQDLKIVRRHNGLRHSYCSALFAKTHNINHVAAMAGNSPGILKKNYRKRMTPEQGKAWFAVAPAPVADNVIPMVKENQA